MAGEVLHCNRPSWLSTAPIRWSGRPSTNFSANGRERNDKVKRPLEIGLETTEPPGCRVPLCTCSSCDRSGVDESPARHAPPRQSVRRFLRQRVSIAFRTQKRTGLLQGRRKSHLGFQGASSADSEEPSFAFDFSYFSPNASLACVAIFSLNAPAFASRSGSRVRTLDSRRATASTNAYTE